MENIDEAPATLTADFEVSDDGKRMRATIAGPGVHATYDGPVLTAREYGPYVKSALIKLGAVVKVHNVPADDGKSRKRRRMPLRRRKH